MNNSKLYTNYAYQLKQYFLFGVSKVLDIWDFNSIDYPSFMTDEEACISDAHEIEKDFIMVGKNLGKAFDSYETNHANNN